MIDEREFDEPNFGLHWKDDRLVSASRFFYLVLLKIQNVTMFYIRLKIKKKCIPKKPLFLNFHFVFFCSRNMKKQIKTNENIKQGKLEMWFLWLFFYNFTQCAFCCNKIFKKYKQINIENIKKDLMLGPQRYPKLLYTS